MRASSIQVINGCRERSLISARTRASKPRPGSRHQARRLDGRQRGEQAYRDQMGNWVEIEPDGGNGTGGRPPGLPDPPLDLSQAI